MSVKNQGPGPEALLPVEELRTRNGIGGPMFAGVCAANGWKPGRAVTEAEFIAAVAGFTSSAMHVSKSVREREVS